MKKKLVMAIMTAITAGMLLSGCDGSESAPAAVENGSNQSTSDVSSTNGGLSASGENGAPGSFIARLEDAPGPGDPNKTQNFVYTSLYYQRIHDTYGIDIISLANPYIKVSGPEDTPTVAVLSSFNTPENIEKVKEYAANTHSDWTLSDENPESCTYIYYDNKTLSGIYPALKYKFGDDYILLDPIYDRIIDGSTQTMRSYLCSMIDECVQEFPYLDYEISFKDNDTLCFSEGTTLKEAFNVYCAYVDQGSSPCLNNLYGSDYLHHFVYGYTGDGFSAGYDVLGFGSIESNTSKFLNIFFNSTEDLSNIPEIQEAYVNDKLPLFLFEKIDNKLAECGVYPFYDRYLDELENWDVYKDSYAEIGINDPMDIYINTAAFESRTDHNGKTLLGITSYGQRFLPKQRVDSYQ